MDINSKEHMQADQTQEHKEQENKANEQAQTNTLDNELAACKAECDIWKDKYFRLSADFQNFNRRLEKDQISFRNSVKKDLLLAILAITDNFDRAMQDISVAGAVENKAWLQGIEMTHKQLYKFLEQQGVKPMNSYTTFDPELHEAVMQVQSDKHEAGTIVEVLQKGYLLDGNVLRTAKVSIAQ